MIGQLLCVILLITERVASEGCHFGYVGSIDETHWGDSEKQCKGKHQSPIDIDSKNVTRKTLPALTMSGFDVPIPATLTNNGHTAIMTKNNCNTKPTISGGPLKGDYEFSQLHFHWGSNDTCGSEDKINNKKYPLELHVVFFKQQYGDFNSALNFPDGLCVLGCLFEIQDKHNYNYDSFSKTLPQIVKPNSAGIFSNPIALFDLIPPVLTSYFTYNGSLTTPPCSEVVTWIDFDNTIKISDAQLQLFRDLVDSEGEPLINNFRSIQPLGDRVVVYNSGEDQDTSSLVQQLQGLISTAGDKISGILNLLTSVI